MEYSDSLSLSCPVVFPGVHVILLRNSGELALSITLLKESSGEFKICDKLLTRPKTRRCGDAVFCILSFGSSGGR